MAQRRLMEIEHLIRYAPLAVGLMEIEKFNPPTERAVGLKPSTIRGKARLHGLERNNYSKTMIAQDFVVWYKQEVEE